MSFTRYHTLCYLYTFTHHTIFWLLGKKKILLNENVHDSYFFVVRYNLRALLSICRQISWDDVIIFNDFESYPGKIHIVGDDLIFPQPQATPEQIITIEPFFFFNFVWKKLFKRWPVRPDLCLECFVVGFFYLLIITFTVFCPKAIKMFDVEMYTISMKKMNFMTKFCELYASEQ